MQNEESLAVIEWAERRDDILARAFARGLSDKQVYEEVVERQGLDLSPEAVAEKRGELYERTVALRSVEGQRLFGHIKALNPAYRMSMVDSWLDGANQAIAWALDTGHQSLVPKLMDAGLKALRYMRDEQDGVRDSGDVEDRRRTQRLARLTPEARALVQQHMSVIEEVLERGTVGVEVVEGEFTVEESAEADE